MLSAHSESWTLSRLRSDSSTTFAGFDRFTETTMTWITPQYTDLRFGFEITMYISAR
ncbi:pyrroloquinoline quinone precursor peptide PqqA [Acidovorax sp.]|uniref:pyrroloquinoline quinone precursor peptide PqqA n=1 Tax=Acidovorax sp. TaxID=1872122 RepID=UPI00344FE859